MPRASLLALTMGLLCLACESKVPIGTQGIDAGVGLPDASANSDSGQGSDAQTMDVADASISSDMGGGLDIGTDTDASQNSDAGGCAECEPVAARTLVAGENHTCMVRGSDTLCWGNINYRDRETHPTTISGLSNPVELAVGREFTCALVSKPGKIVCWGGLEYNGSHLTNPTEIPGINDAVQIDAGRDHLCAVRQSGGIVCLGDNSHGQLGNGTLTDATAPVSVMDLSNAIQVSVGAEHSCAAIQSGEVYCWGRGKGERLGSGARSDRSPQRRPARAASARETVQVAAGSRHTCALSRNGTVRCWGYNSSHALGTTNTTAFSSIVPQLTKVVELSTQGETTCARRSTGAIVCWGRNDRGQLGAGVINRDGIAERGTPTVVDRIHDAVHITVGSFHACALSSDGNLRCWGHGALTGDGRQQVALSPVIVPLDNMRCNYPAADCDNTFVNGCEIDIDRDKANCGGCGMGCQGTEVCLQGQCQEREITQLSVGVSHACLATNSGDIYCWGSNGGKAITSEPGVYPHMPLLVSQEGPELSELYANDANTCFRRENGSIACRGTLISMVTYDEVRPHPDMIDVVDLSHRSWYGCMARDNGTVSCFGRSYGNTIYPRQIRGFEDAIQIETGSDHFCALLNTGHVECMGSNNLGQLGDGTDLDFNMPRRVKGLSNAHLLRADQNRSCAIYGPQRQLTCWGHNNQGQAGAGTAEFVNEPFDVPGLSQVVDVSLSLGHTCALTSDGVVHCFGSNRRGEIGNGGIAMEPVLTPHRVAGITATKISVGLGFSCALADDGQAYCWGSNRYGQLGNGTQIDEWEPTPVSF